MLLAIDTSTTTTGIACYDASGVLAECVWHSGRDHTSQLLPQLDLLLQHLQRSRDTISAVAVALGPGSWSGLRVGVSTAKGLALARDLPLIGIGTLDALAYQHQQHAARVYPLVRLGRDRFATATYPPAEPPQPAAPRNLTLAELGDDVNGPTWFCGDIDAEMMALLRKQCGANALFPSPAANGRRPGMLAELAWQRLTRGDVDDLATLEPIYLGHPVKART